MTPTQKKIVKSPLTWAAATLFIAWFFFFKMIAPGYVGVVIDLFGEKKGVEAKELHVGMHWVAPWKSIHKFPIFEQNYTWEGLDAFTFQTSEGMAVSADLGITYHLDPASIPKIFAKYRTGMREITHVFIRNHIRDAINKAASKMKIEDLYGNSKELFFDSVEQHVRQDLSPMGILISRIYLIGRFHFPQNVLAALNSKIEAIQRAQQRENELREAEAEAKKQIAQAEGAARCKTIAAQAEAQSNKILSNSLTVELMIWKAIEQWDGKLPQVVGNSQPIVDLNQRGLYATKKG